MAPEKADNRISLAGPQQFGERGGREKRCSRVRERGIITASIFRTERCISPQGRSFPSTPEMAATPHFPMAGSVSHVRPRTLEPLRPALIEPRSRSATHGNIPALIEPGMSALYTENPCPDRAAIECATHGKVPALIELRSRSAAHGNSPCPDRAAIECCTTHGKVLALIELGSRSTAHGKVPALIEPRSSALRTEKSLPWSSWDREALHTEKSLPWSSQDRVRYTRKIPALIACDREKPPHYASLFRRLHSQKYRYEKCLNPCLWGDPYRYIKLYPWLAMYNKFVPFKSYFFVPKKNITVLSGNIWEIWSSPPSLYFWDVTWAGEQWGTSSVTRLPQLSDD